MLTALILAACLSADDATKSADRVERIAAFLKSAKKSALEKSTADLKLQEKQLAKINKARVTAKEQKERPGTKGEPPLVFGSRDAKQQAVDSQKAKVDRLKESIRQIEANDPPFVPELSAGCELGDVGVAEGGKVAIEQILGANSMIVGFGYTRPGVKIIGTPGNQIVVDDIKFSRVSFVLRGISTKGKIENRMLDLVDAVEVVDTQQFAAESLFVLKIIPAEELKAALESP